LSIYRHPRCRVALLNGRWRISASLAASVSLDANDRFWRKRSLAGCRPTLKGRSARRYLRHHRPRSRDIGQYSLASYGPGAVELRVGYRSCDKSELPSYAASNACHMRRTPSRCFQPSDELAEHTGGLIYEDCYEGGWERDNANRSPGALVTRLRLNSWTAP
jgi:hypothetical protein